MSVFNPNEASYDDDYFERLHKLNWHGNNQYREQQRLETIEVLCCPKMDDDFLELGCGTGIYTRALAPRVKRIVGVDNSATAIERAKTEGMTGNIEYILADIQNLEIFPAESFDKILAIDVLEHLSNPQLEAVLVEVRRILKKDGVLAFFTPCRSHWIECLKDKNIVLKQFEEHIGVRTEKEYRQVVAGLDLKVKSVLRYETCLPILRSFDRILKTIPVAGNLFVSRIAMAVSK